MNYEMYQTENKSFFVFAGWVKICILTKTLSAYRKLKRQMQQRWSMLSNTLFWGSAEIRQNCVANTIMVAAQWWGRREQWHLLNEMFRPLHCLPIVTHILWIWHVGIGSKILPSPQIYWIHHMKSRSWLSFLQSVIHAFIKFTRRSIKKARKSVLKRCKP